MILLLVFLACTPTQHLDTRMLEEVLETTCSSSFFNAIDAEEIAFSQRAIFTTATNTSLDTSGGSGWLEVEEDAEIEGMLLLRVDDEELYLDAEGVFDGQTSSFSDEVYFSFTLGHTWCEDGTFIAATSATAMTHDLVLLGQLRQADPEESWSYYGNADIWAQVMDVELLQGSYDPNLTPEELSEELTLAAYGTMNRAW